MNTTHGVSRSARFPALCLCLAAAMSSACSGLVGEQCAPGYVASKDACVPQISFASVVGQGVFLGMDFSGIAPGSREAHLLGNAVFLSSHKPVRILDYRELTDWNSSSVTNVVDLIAGEAIVRRRTVQTAVAHDAASVPSALDQGDVDVLFVHDQVDAPPGALADVGASWEPAISRYLGAGGIVIVLATATGRNEMAALLSTSGLLPVSGLMPTTSAHLGNVAPGDPVGHGVRVPMHGAEAFAYFVADDPSMLRGETVLSVAADEPVVLHIYR